MADPVDLVRMLPDTQAFLTELAQNNARDWFRNNKARYDSQLKRPAEKLLAQIAAWLSAHHAVQPRTKLFRPHRDVRFSEDKAPYHTHLHMMWSLADGRTWMLGIAPDYATAGAGVMQFNSPQVVRWQESMITDRGADLATMLGQMNWRVDPPASDTLPAGCPADHPRSGLLPYTGFVAWQDNLETALSTDPETALHEAFSRFTPLMNWLEKIA